MEDLHIWNAIFAAGFATVGFVLRYLFMKVQQVVPEQEIRRMITDSIAPEQVKQAMIYERLIHIEDKLDRLLEERRNDSGRESR